MRKSITFLLSLGLLIGCVNKPLVNQDAPKDTVVITESMTDVSISDSEVLYKIFSGLSYFMKNAGKSIDTTPKLFKLIEDVQKEYDYKREKYVKFSYSVAKYLETNGYKQPKNIIDIVTDDKKEIAREKVVTDMQSLADAIKRHMDKKNVK